MYLTFGRLPNGTGVNKDDICLFGSSSFHRIKQCCIGIQNRPDYLRIVNVHLATIRLNMVFQWLVGSCQRLLLLLNGEVSLYRLMGF